MKNSHELLGFVFCLLPVLVEAGEQGTISIGPRLQKSMGLYWENGLAADYASALWKERIHFGFSVVTSRLGSAFDSNALKQEKYFFSAGARFRHDHLLRPICKISVGYFYADYEVDIFDDLPNTSSLFSLEGGIAIDPPSPAQIDLTLGYNLITGNGVNGPGTLYPFFYQITVSWAVYGGKN
jgi:hypothetical protein